MTKKTTKKTTKTTRTSTQKHPKTTVKSVKRTRKKKESTPRKINKKLTIIVILLLAILLIFSTYAWFSTNLNVKIKTFRMVIQKNSDLSISFDGINFEHSLEINKETIIDELNTVYPNHTNQWAANGFIPVSSAGIPTTNTPKFNMYETSGVMYARKDREKLNGFLRTRLAKETEPREYNSYLAFDVFIKNDTGSPVADNLYLQDSTIIQAVDENITEEMLGLVNSFRIGFVRIGSVGLKASVDEIQNITCNSQCEEIIFEPNSKNHTALSIERAAKHNVQLVDGIKYPTYAYKAAGGPIYVKDSIPGSKLDPQFFELQDTRDENDFDNPIFQIPNGITKARIYIWIEGQDVDSIETDSEGAEVEIGIDFTKDTAGWDAFDE